MSDPSTSASNVNGNNPFADLCPKIGGRVVTPALPVVDGAPPTSLEKSFQATLDVYSATNIPLESRDGLERRERVLNQMGQVCREWIQAVAKSRKLPPDVVDNAGGKLYTSGSYRLGVHEPGADIDTILVAPAMCHRSDFFGTTNPPPSSADDPNSSSPPLLQRDPQSLAERIRNHPHVTNFVSVETAAVPILTFDWEGVNIDLLFARIHNSNAIGIDFDIDRDSALDGADSATEKSLNGPRVTNLIAALVSGTSQRYQTFLQVVRCVRKWAKARGLYSNKSGYWGGVNINIGVALVLQLYPNACAASVLRRFFLVFKTWRWPQPVLLTKPHDAGYGLPVWTAQASAGGPRHHHQVAPMITPAYPAMNSTLSVSRQTLQILQGEFERAHSIVDQLWKHFQQHPQEPLDWAPLFQPSDFFIAYPVRWCMRRALCCVLLFFLASSFCFVPSPRWPFLESLHVFFAQRFLTCSRYFLTQHYLSLCIVGPTQTDAQAWGGFVESRLRKLVSDGLARSLPLKKIQLWPKKFEVCVADPGAILTLAQRQNSSTYFVGFQIDLHRMRGTALNVELPLQHFRLELSRYHPFVPGMDVLAKHFTVKLLPQFCFESMYPGGKVEAMRKRRQLRNDDPVRQEQRKLARLAELKAKMAEIQKRQQDEEDREAEKHQRKRDAEMAELDNDDYEVALEGDEETKPGEPGATVTEGENEETNLLESALDTIQDTGDAKTREQAEADRRKLLAGELLEADEATADAAADDSDEDDYGYTADRGRHSLLQRTKDPSGTSDDGNDEGPAEHRDIRSLPIPEADAEMLKKLGYAIVSDDESTILGANLLPPWRDGNQAPDDVPPEARPRLTIRFLEKFDVVELDALGHVIDRGDDDYRPSKIWQGRKAGFEFKLGERGLGYYRTGKRVVVPSNTAY